ncbi:MAG: carbamoyltransferase N-terminal domain-containing protein [Myxococcaceae bacterium]
MSATLGISANSHDAAAALVVDGTLVAAMQQERFSRIKNDPSLPLSAARACLSFAKLDAKDLTRVVFYENPYRKLERVLTMSLRTFPRSLGQFPRALAAQLSGKLQVLDELSSRLGVQRDRVTYREHHESHAASAFFQSPFERAAVLTVDAVGEETTTALWLGEGRSLKELERIAFPHSLGLLYSALTAWCGFEVNEGEYKVMGLAAFGQPRFRDEFRKLITLAPDGSFSLGLEYFDSHTNTEVGFSSKLEALLGPRRTPGAPWDLTSDADRHVADVACTLQTVLEEALLGLARRAKERTGAYALCLAGGVGLNAVANARLAREAGFRDFFVQPAAGDAGAALGAAILGALDTGDARPAPLTSLSLGLPVSSDDARTIGKNLGLVVTPLSGRDDVADLLAKGEILAFAEGRFEFGPRALGNRSLLALPTPIAVKERLNRVIKRREPFRPFAPAVLEAEALRFFEPFAERLAPFMVTVAGVKPEARPSLEAITHVDGTARLQTVSPHSRFGALIEAVGRRTGTPVVLNTSLNGKGDPIVASVADAFAFFLGHPADALVVDDVLIRKP